jgi:hypothetical protein
MWLKDLVWLGKDLPFAECLRDRDLALASGQD